MFNAIYKDKNQIQDVKLTSTSLFSHTNSPFILGLYNDVLLRRGAYCFAPVGRYVSRSVDKTMSAQYLENLS
jgi:hypothetical protein